MNLAIYSENVPGVLRLIHHQITKQILLGKIAQYTQPRQDLSQQVLILCSCSREEHFLLKVKAHLQGSKARTHVCPAPIAEETGDEWSCIIGG